MEQSDLKSPRFYELGGDFYKSFGENELANEWYDKALDSDLNETQNLIELKPSENKLLSILSAFVLLGCQTLGFVEVDQELQQN